MTVSPTDPGAGPGRSCQSGPVTAPRPTPQDLAEAPARRLRDIVTGDLEVLFCGINPGLRSGAVGHHFARPGNRFWRVLHLAGLTSRELRPEEAGELLAAGLGITNIVGRATATAAELGRDELADGWRTVVEKTGRFAPRALAVLGMQAYRSV